MTFTSNIGKNGLTFIHMNEPLWRTIQSRMHCEKKNDTENGFFLVEQIIHTPL